MGSWVPFNFWKAQKIRKNYPSFSTVSMLIISDCKGLSIKDIRFFVFTIDLPTVSNYYLWHRNVWCLKTYIFKIGFLIWTTPTINIFQIWTCCSSTQDWQKGIQNQFLLTVVSSFKNLLSLQIAFISVQFLEVIKFLFRILLLLLFAGFNCTLNVRYISHKFYIHLTVKWNLSKSLQ